MGEGKDGDTYETLERWELRVGGGWVFFLDLEGSAPGSDRFEEVVFILRCLGATKLTPRSYLIESSKLSSLDELPNDLTVLITPQDAVLVHAPGGRVFALTGRAQDSDNPLL